MVNFVKLWQIFVESEVILHMQVQQQNHRLNHYIGYMDIYFADDVNHVDVAK